MIAIFSDTHSDRGHELEGAALDAARDADSVIHAGDFISPSSLEAFQEVSAALFAVHGNADSDAVRERLPPERVVDEGGLRIALTHRRNGGRTGLALFGRAQDADLVVSGHTHRPGITRTDDVLLLNPGSHAQPRGNRPGFATLERTADGAEVRLMEPDGTVIDAATMIGE